jgi:hypothetical protein
VQTGMTLTGVSRSRIGLAAAPEGAVPPIRELWVPCTETAIFGETLRRKSALAAANGFLRREDSRLLVLLGAHGMGKSQLLRRIAKELVHRGEAVPLLITYPEVAAGFHSQSIEVTVSEILRQFSYRAASEFSELVRSQADRIVIIVDGCDNPVPGWSAGSRPARRLVPFVSSRVKIVVAATPSLRASIATVMDEAALDRDVWGSTRPAVSILQLEGCSVATAAKALRGSIGSLPRVGRGYLERVRRPLYLNMLAGSLEMLKEPSSFSMWRLYDSYAKAVLAASSDMLLMPLKQGILRDLAFAIFESGYSGLPRRLSIGDGVQVAEAEIGDAESVGSLRRFPSARDLLVGLAPLVLLSSGRPGQEDVLSFAHESFFEFFLSEYLASRLHREGRLGLDDSGSSWVLNSLVPNFLRSRFGLAQADSVLTMLRNAPSLIDRFLGLFFIEDHPEALEMLRSSDVRYRRFLHRIVNNAESELIWKAARFQLVLLGRGVAKGLSYVSDVRILEDSPEDDMEVHTVADEVSPTNLLLARLSNPRLHQALPITVYRLGLFGDSRALSPLVDLLGRTRSPGLKEYISEAIARIDSRCS